MALHEVLKFPNKVLTTKTEIVTDFSETPQLIKDMIETAITNNLIGLAANQIGVPKSVIIVKVQSSEQKKNEFSFASFINPVIKPVTTKGEKWDWEGCGSIPNWNFLIKRWNEINVKAYTSKGEPFETNATGYIARIIQHEVSHLKGELITIKARERRKV